MLSDSKISDLYFEALGSQHLREQDRKTVSRFALAVEAEVRKDYDALISQMLEALDECAEDSATVVNDYVQAYGENHRPLRLKAMRETVTKAKDALAAARARLEKAP